MNYSIFRFTLNMHNLRSQVSVPVFKNDTGIRLVISLTDGGNAYFIEDGCIARLRGKKPDGMVFNYGCVIEKNTRIIFDFTEQTAICEGIVNCELSLYGSDGKLITCPKFIIVVDSRVAPGNAFIDAIEDEAESKTEIDIVDELVMAAVSEESRKNAEAERRSAEEKRQKAEENRQAVFRSFEDDVVFRNKDGGQFISGGVAFFPGENQDTAVEVNGNLDVVGDLYIKGTTKTIDHETVTVQDNILVVNSEGASFSHSGLIINKGNGKCYGILYQPTDDVVCIGEGTLSEDGEFTYDSGEAVPLAARNGTFENGSIPIWNSEENAFVSSGKTFDSLGGSEDFTWYDQTYHGAGAKELFISYCYQSEVEQTTILPTHLVQVRAENEETWSEYDGEYEVTKHYKTGKYTYKGNGTMTTLLDDSEYSGRISKGIYTGTFTLVLDGMSGEYSLTFEGASIWEREEAGVFTNINLDVTITDFPEMWDYFGTMYHKY